MITLKDYLGTIVANINAARGQADIESANLAAKYAKDDVLQYYSIPRMRMQDIELTIPIGIDKIEKKEHADYQPIDNNSFYSSAYQTLTSAYGVRSFPRATSQRVSKVLKVEIANLEKGIKADDQIEKHLAVFANKVSKESAKLIKLNAEQKKKLFKPEERLINVETALKKRLIASIKPRQMDGSIGNAQIIAESERLRELPLEKTNDY